MEGGYGVVQLLFLLLAYAYVLFTCSNMISDGSELLLLVPSMAGVVGSVVLPVLGAVPDGAIVLFSGLGPGAQDQLSVGVGALAGSTIMLLTVPWSLSVVAGRVDYKGGAPSYRGKPKLSPGGLMSGLTTTGVQKNGKGGTIMLLSCVTYLIIQGPAFFTPDCIDKPPGCPAVRGEATAALIGMIVSTLGFFGYIVYCFKVSSEGNAADALEAKTTAAKEGAIKGNMMNLTGAFAAQISELTAATGGGDLKRSLSGGDAKVKAKVEKFIGSFFKKYDENKDGKMDRTEMKLLMKDLNEPSDDATIQNLFDRADDDRSGTIDIHEFNNLMFDFMKENIGGPKQTQMSNPASSAGSLNAPAAGAADVGAESEEEDEIPEEWADLDPKEQQKRIVRRSMFLMCTGTFFVLLFSDPMCDVLSALGGRLGIGPFYVSFVLAPLASNASELIASYKYALKKTKKTISISLEALEGAAIMNNTFCLAIFLALIYFKGLKWEFTAETISILGVQLIMFVVVHRETHPAWHAFAVASLYPLSLVIVWALETKAGLN